MALSVCLLTRNDRDQIARAVRSVLQVSHEIVVVDMNSGDGTQQAATEAGARVMTYNWAEDFSAARHFAFDQTRGDWILWLNPSEELSPESHGALHAAQQRDDAVAFFVRIRNVFTPRQPDQYVETGAIRLFKRRPDLRFEGRLHPHLAPSFADSIAREGKKVDGSEIILINHDPTYVGGQMTETQLRFNARLLELELRDHPGQLHYLIEQGRVLLQLKDPRAPQILAEATQLVANARSNPTPAAHKTQVLLEYLLHAPHDAPALRILSQADARDLAVKWFPNSPPLMYQIAQERFGAGDIGRSAMLLEHLIQLGKNKTYDPSSPFDPALVGEDAWINLAACYRRMGRWDDAQNCYRQLSSSPKYSKQATEGIAAVERLRQR